MESIKKEIKLLQKDLHSLSNEDSNELCFIKRLTDIVENLVKVLEV